MRGTRWRGHVQHQKQGIIPAHAGNTHPNTHPCPRTWDHPRACGEHRVGIRGSRCPLGSSPRMRGTHPCRLSALGLAGIIPAHAGNTGGDEFESVFLGDHPRACGEHRLALSLPHGLEGSSPRMRGTLHGGVDALKTAGIIPAHAGNTAPCTLRPAGCRDHPRACGEHTIRFKAGSLDMGSSPRMRGTPYGTVVAKVTPRIIPAHAGNTRIVSFQFQRIWDHPRACGEHTSLPTVSFIAMGSSPRMRGTPVIIVPEAYGVGIIPAHAGNTVNCGVTCLVNGDHPRACGEHRSVDEVLDGAEGSSPRMRGTPTRWSYTLRCGRIIPAHAGNTGILFSSAPQPGDHPRACGEHGGYPVSYGEYRGSSPRMRGTLGGDRLKSHIAGIIPAHAGNTRTLRTQAGYYRDHPRACGEHRHFPYERVHNEGSSPRMRGTLSPSAVSRRLIGIIPAHAGNTYDLQLALT